MIPTPTHLANFTEPLNRKEEKEYKVKERFPGEWQNQYSAKIKCDCGSYSFILLYPGEINEYGPCVTEINGEYYFIIKAKCTKCGKEHLIFDNDFHGWNGWICHDPKKAELPRPELTPWKCSKCSSQKHRMVVIINSQGKEDFLQEAGEEFDQNRWQDAFDWISLDIACEDCGFETRDLISYETM